MQKAVKRKAKPETKRAAKDQTGNKRHREDFDWLLKKAVDGQN